MQRKSLREIGILPYKICVTGVRLEGPIKITVTNAIAEGDQVFVEAEGESRTKDGLDYNNLYGIVLRLKDGKITEVREYMDTELVKAIFG